MTKRLGIMTLAVGVSFSVVAAMQNQATPQEQPAAAPPAAPAGTGLSDLAALTRSCSTAALNAAARRAADAPSQGKYQFSYFNPSATRTTDSTKCISRVTTRGSRS
jgi:hypothetical protein